MDAAPPPTPDDARRGTTGEDRTARDWAGSDEPDAPAEVQAAEAAAAEKTGAGKAGTEQAGTDKARTESGADKPSADEAGADKPAGRARRVVAAKPLKAASRAKRPAAPAEEAPETSADVLPSAPKDAGGPARKTAGAAGGTTGGTAIPGPSDAASGVPTEAATGVPSAAAADPPGDTPGDAAEAPRQLVRATGPARRPPLLVQGLWPAVLAGGLIAATLFGLLPLAVAVLGVQVFLVLGALALLDAPASGGAFLLAVGTIVAADAVVLAGDGDIGGLAGVTGLGFVATLVHQLLRRNRSRVTESLADTLVVIVVAVSAACLLGLRQVDGGEQVLLVSLAAAGSVLLLGRVGDQLAPQPILAVGSTRGWPGLLLGLGAGVAVAVLVADVETGDGALPLRAAALIGLVVASTVATADLAVDLGAAELRAGWRDARRVAALRPTALLLPFALVGPVALLAGRLVLA